MLNKNITREQRLEKQLAKFASWLDDASFTCKSNHYTLEEKLNKLRGNLNNMTHVCTRVSKHYNEAGI